MSTELSTGAGSAKAVSEGTLQKKQQSQKSKPDKKDKSSKSDSASAKKRKRNTDGANTGEDAIGAPTQTDGDGTASSTKKHSKKRKTEHEEGVDKEKHKSKSKGESKDKDKLHIKEEAESKSREHKDKQKHKERGKDRDKSSTKAYKAPKDSLATSPFFTQTSSFSLPLAPIAQGSPLEGLCAEHLSPLILSYVQAFKGVVLSYSNPRFTYTSTISDPLAAGNGDGDGGSDQDGSGRDWSSEQPEAGDGSGVVKREAQVRKQAYSRAVAEYAASYTWLTADFTLLRPPRSAWVEGVVTLQSKDFIGLVVWNLFNASIAAIRLPETWLWRRGGGGGRGGGKVKHALKAKKGQKGSAKADQEGEADDDDDDDDDGADLYADADAGLEFGGDVVEGHWTDDKGDKVEGLLRFRVRDLETTPSHAKENGFVSLEGSLLRHEKDDRKVDLRLHAEARARAAADNI